MKWGISVYRPNFDIMKSLDFSILGLKEQYWKRASHMSPGDKVVIYIARQGKIAGILEVVSPPFKERTKIWLGSLYDFEDEIFPLRVKTKPFLILNEDQMIDVHELIPLLSVTRGVERWGYFFQKSLYILKEGDYKLIEQRCRQSLKGNRYERKPLSRPGSGNHQ